MRRKEKERRMKKKRKRLTNLRKLLVNTSISQMSLFQRSKRRRVCRIKMQWLDVEKSGVKCQKKRRNPIKSSKLKINRGILLLNYKQNRYDKQAEEITAKGYYIRADGTKSNVAEETGKKRKSTKSVAKGGKKSASKSKDLNKSMKSNAGKKSAKKDARKSSKGKQQKQQSDDENGLDIEGDSVGQSE